MIFLDITTQLQTPFISGIQRVVDDLIGSGKFRLLYRTPTFGASKWIEVEKIPIRRNSIRSKIKGLFFKLLLLLGIKFFPFLSQHPIAYRIVWIFRVALLERMQLSKVGYRKKKKSNWRQEISVLFVADIPKPNHLERLVELGSEGNWTIVYYVHDLIPINYANLFTGHDPERISRFEKYLDIATKNDLILVNSSKTKLELSTWLKIKKRGRRKISICLPGMDFPHKVDLLPNIDPMFKHRTKVTALKELKILLVGNRDKRKNFALIFKALGILQLKIPITITIVSPSLTLVCAEYRDSKRKLLELNPSIHIVERNNLSDADLQREYENCNLVCVPSLAEGFCFPVLEARLHNKIVISGAESVCPELARDLKVKVITEYSPRKWASEIREVCLRPKNETTPLAAFTKYSRVSFADRITRSLSKVGAH